MRAGFVSAIGKPRTQLSQSQEARSLQQSVYCRKSQMSIKIMDVELLLHDEERSDGKTKFSKKERIPFPALSFNWAKASSSGKDDEQQHLQSGEGHKLLRATSSPEISPRVSPSITRGRGQSFKSLTNPTSSGNDDEQHSQSGEGHEVLFGATNPADLSSSLTPSYQLSPIDERQKLQLLRAPSYQPSHTEEEHEEERMPPSQEQERNNPNQWARWCSAFFRWMYGRESIWHHMLYGPPKDGGDGHPMSDIVCALGLITVLVLAYVLVSKSQSSWPQHRHIYYTTSFNASAGNPDYTCGCILPPSLQSPPENPKDDRANLNYCYQPSMRETVTILMYSTSADKLINDVIERQHSEWQTPTSITLNTGWNVTQNAYELSIQNPDFELEYLTPLYPGGEREPIAYPLVEHSKFPNNFPGAYIQMYWIYDCNDCQTCSLKEVNILSRKVVNESWVSCYYYGSESQCATSNNYTAKCVLYPPESLPIQFAVRRFLDQFLDLPGISNVRGKIEDRLEVANYSAALQPDILYLKSTPATRSQIQLRFLEVRKDSGTWAIVSGYFPTFETECALLPQVQVCNGSSLCNLFSSTAGFSLGCIDFENSTECQPFKYNVTPDNTNLTSAINVNEVFADQIVCPANINCSLELPYLVTWNVLESAANDGLNSFLASSILPQELLWEKSEVCTKTYRNVIRYPRDGDANDQSETMFLESQCSNATVSQPSFCWLTGYYHNLSDLPSKDTTWEKLPETRFWRNDNLLVCYKMEKQKRTDRFVNNFGVMFGWFGTIVLVFYGLFSVWILWRENNPLLCFSL